SASASRRPSLHDALPICDDIIKSFDVNLLNVSVNVYFETNTAGNKVAVNLEFIYDYGDDARGDLRRLLHYEGVFTFGFDDLKSLDRKSTRLNSSHVKISY